MMLRGENSRDVVDRVKAKVDQLNCNNVLPDGIKLVPYYDRSDIVNASVSTVNKALIEGAILVLIILYLLLRSFRGSIVVLIALPLSLLITFIVMKAVGLSANLMSLGGLAISIGMIIDATIIQVENVQRHLSENKKEGNKLLTVLKSVIEVRKPSILGGYNSANFDRYWIFECGANDLWVSSERNMDMATDVHNAIVLLDGSQGRMFVGPGVLTGPAARLQDMLCGAGPR